MPGRLTERNGEQAGAAYLLDAEVTTIGRNEDNGIVVRADSISGRHAEVRWNGQDYVLADLGSKNGTWLNGARLTHAQALRPGDVLTLPRLPPLHLVFDIVKETVTVAPDIVEGAFSSGRPALPAPGPAELVIDVRTAQVWTRGQQVNLTAKEYQALLVLYRGKGALISRQDLASEVWPEYGGVIGEQNIEQLIYRLRRKLETDPEHPRHLLTVRGLGYRLVLA